MMRAHTVMSTAALVACLAIGAAAGPASATDGTGGGNSSTAEGTSSPSFTVTSDGWIQYDSVLSQVGASAEVSSVAGQRDASGACTSTGASSSRATTSTAVVYTEEVAFNPLTCDSRVATSVLTPAQSSQIEALTSSSPSTSSPSMSSTERAAANTAASSANATTSLATATVYSRWLKTAWIDPINITISSQRAGLRWTSTAWSYWQYKRDSFKGCIGGVCLDETYIVSGSNALSYVANGWQFNAKVHFRNTSFALWVVAILGPTGWAACGFPLSSQADFYHSDTVTGYKSGASAWNWSDSKSGACTNLVHHGSWTGTTFS